jgi:hypothetical protein
MSFLNNIVGKGMPLLNVFGHFAGWGAQNGAIGGITGMPSSATRSKLEGGGSAPNSLLEQQSRMGASQTIDYGNVTGMESGTQRHTGDAWPMDDTEMEVFLDEEGMSTEMVGGRPTSPIDELDVLMVAAEIDQANMEAGNPPLGKKNSDSHELRDEWMEVFLDEQGMPTKMIDGRPTSVMTANVAEANSLDAEDEYLELEIGNSGMGKKNSDSHQLTAEQMKGFLAAQGSKNSKMHKGKPTNQIPENSQLITSASSNRKSHTITHIMSKFAKNNDPAPSNRYKITFGTVGTPQAGGIDNILAKRNKSNCPVADIDFVQLLCKTAEMPGKSFATGDQRTYGPLIKRPFDMITTEITMTFLITEQYSSRKFFTNWMDIIHADNNHNFAYYNDFVAPEVRIEYLNKGLTESPYGVILKNAYPMAIGPIALAYDQTDQIQEFTVTFTYENWKQECRDNRPLPANEENLDDIAPVYDPIFDVV